MAKLTLALPLLPHALASFVLGESHASGDGASTPIVSASFVSDASKVTACTASLAGCTVAKPAVCDGVSGPLCPSGQTCFLDSACLPACQATAPCTAQCPVGQECYFETSTVQACRASQGFDGGDLVFSGPGLVSPITLLPPAYAFAGGTGTGGPLVPGGGAIQVTGSGSAGAGFAAFRETFSATTRVQTVPSLSTLTPANVYASQGLAVGWAPGADAISVGVSGPGGTASCPAADQTGALTVPSAVVHAVAGTGAAGVTVTVTRERLTVSTDGRTQGALAGESLPPLGYFDLTTSSAESFTLVGCGTLATCSDGCQDLSTSIDDCGACGAFCNGACSAGACSGAVVTCASPLLVCNGACVDPRTSTANCGRCGASCPSGDSCVGGSCAPATTGTGTGTGTVVLFGGATGVAAGALVLVDDTWTFDGVSWEEVAVGASPPARSNHAMATLGDKVVMFGGSSGSEYFNDTWTFDGARWEQVAIANPPPARSGHGMVTVGDTIVMFGGGYEDGEESYLSDTWTFDGAAWTEVNVPQAPCACDDFALAPSASGAVLFGGFGSNGANYPDTWTFDGAGWTNVASASGADAPAVSFYYSTGNVGGRAVYYDEDGSMFAFTGTSWTQYAASNAPPAHVFTAMTIRGDEAVLFGGQVSSLTSTGTTTYTAVNDTWTLDGTTWKQVPTAGAPPARIYHAMATLP